MGQRWVKDSGQYMSPLAPRDFLVATAGPLVAPVSSQEAAPGFAAWPEREGFPGVPVHTLSDAFLMGPGILTLAPDTVMASHRSGVLRWGLGCAPGSPHLSLRTAGLLPVLCRVRKTPSSSLKLWLQRPLVPGLVSCFWHGSLVGLISHLLYVFPCLTHGLCF